jgi:hypothetical protein
MVEFTVAVINSEKEFKEFLGKYTSYSGFDVNNITYPIKLPLVI